LKKIAAKYNGNASKWLGVAANITKSMVHSFNSMAMLSPNLIPDDGLGSTNKIGSLTVFLNTAT
jgi:cytochrome c551/c552